jgi:hypothetical protein
METSKYCEDFQISRKISAEFSSDGWQCRRNVRAPPAASLFCSGQFVFNIIFSCIVCACISCCYRASLRVATDWVRAVSVFMGRCAWRRGYCTLCVVTEPPCTWRQIESVLSAFLWADVPGGVVTALCVVTEPPCTWRQIGSVLSAFLWADVPGGVVTALRKVRGKLRITWRNECTRMGEGGDCGLI